ALCSSAISILLDLYKSTELFYYIAYAQRMSPLLLYCAALALQLASLIVYEDRTHLRVILKEETQFLKTWLMAFGGILMLTIALAATRLGLDADPVGWGKPTVPLLEWQIWLGILLCVLSRAFAQSRSVKWFSEFQANHSILSGLVLSLSIWGSATALWISQPVPPGFFATPPRAPNFEIYPFSDAAFYDFHAQSLLIGLGFRGDTIPPRPLYIVFLAAAHLIAGQEYTRVILVQTLVLALFPVIIFWIGKKLANRTVGFVAALMIILREWTSILSTPFTSDISNSKLLFADLPAALVISLLLLIVLMWLEKPRHLVFALSAGGILGICLLVRTQIIILLPVILIFYWITARKVKFNLLILPTAVFIIGFVLAVAPWLSRNYRITGQFVFDHPESQTRVMAQRYSPETELTDMDRRPDETFGMYNQRLTTFIRQQMLKNPSALVHFVAAHWLNNEISNLMIFPIRFSINSPVELVVPQRPFWEEWVGNLSPGQFLILLLNLSVLTAGTVYLVRKKSWVGLLPLAFNAAYHFSNAAARNSGWRYLLPADWVFLLYFAGGVYILTNLGNNHNSGIFIEPDWKNSTNKPEYMRLSIVATLLLLAGSLPQMAETAFPRVFPLATVDTARQLFFPAPGGLSFADQAGIEKILQDPNVIVLNGRMLYPRYYGEKEGEEKTGKTGYAPMPYSRYVFLIAGVPEGTIIFPHISAELPLRNAETALVIGCMDGLAVNARVVAVETLNSQPYIAAAPVDWSCSSVK
ncbi:MAG: hypothetical protein WCG34_02030, partial [Leptolinea sp.]